MPQTLANDVSGKGRRTVALTAAFGASALISCLAPRATVILLTLTMAAILVVSTTGRGLLADLRRDTAARVGAAFLLYLVVSAGLSLDPAAGYRKLAVVALIFAVWLLAWGGLERASGPAVSRGASAFLIGCLAGAALLTFEVLSDQALIRLLYNAFPILRPESTKHIGMAVGQVIMVGPYTLNRNLALLVLMIWPALAILSNRSHGPMRWLLAGGLVVLAAVAILPSEHETSQIALVVGILVFALSQLSSRIVVMGLAAVWCLAFVAAIPAARVAYDVAELHKADWLPETGRARIIMWGYTAKQIPKAPILGIGIRSTRVLDKRQLANVEKPADHVVRPRPGRHAHNLFLQTWFELGLIGVAFLIALGLLVLRRIARMPETIRPFANAQFAAFVAVAAFAWGMWQSWLLAGYALTTLYLLLAERLLRDGTAAR